MYLEVAAEVPAIPMKSGITGRIAVLITGEAITVAVVIGEPENISLGVVRAVPAIQTLTTIIGKTAMLTTAGTAQNTGIIIVLAAPAFISEIPNPISPL